jgi:hypothetical protein
MPSERPSGKFEGFGATEASRKKANATAFRERPDK